MSPVLLQIDGASMTLEQNTQSVTNNLTCAGLHRASSNGSVSSAKVNRRLLSEKRISKKSIKKQRKEKRE